MVRITIIVPCLPKNFISIMAFHITPGENYISLQFRVLKINPRFLITIHPFLGPKSKCLYI